MFRNLEKGTPSLTLPKALALVEDDVLLKLATLAQQSSDSYRERFPEIISLYDTALSKHRSSPLLRFCRLSHEPTPPVIPEKFVPYIHLYREVTPMLGEQSERLVSDACDALDRKGFVKIVDFGEVNLGPDYYLRVTESGMIRAAELRATK